MSLLESRVKETEVTKNMSVLSKQLSELQRQLKMKTESIASLEKELNEANYAMESSTFTRKTNSSSSSLTPPKHYTSTSGSDSTDSPRKHAMQSSSSSSLSQAVKPSSSLNEDSDNAMLHAIQAQRDRYMKLAKENEQEVLLLKTRLDRYVHKLLH